MIASSHKLRRRPSTFLRRPRLACRTSTKPTGTTTSPATKCIPSSWLDRPSSMSTSTCCTCCSTSLWCSSRRTSYPFSICSTCFIMGLSCIEIDYSLEFHSEKISMRWTWVQKSWRYFCKPQLYQMNQTASGYHWFSERKSWGFESLFWGQAGIGEPARNVWWVVPWFEDLWLPEL